MKKEAEIVISPAGAADRERIKKKTARVLGLNLAEISAVTVVRRSIDARKKDPVYRLKVRVYINEEPEPPYKDIDYLHVKGNRKVHIIGSGPAGLFAALRAIELGIKPVVIERGKDVQARRRDLRSIQQEGIVNEDSNYCFGEGGAGTYSDGKLYTRSTKKGNIGKILKILVQHGASGDILVDSQPHIGSNKLPKVISEIRETILRCGGEIHFESRMTGFKNQDGRIESIIINDSCEVKTEAVILATGHSARDIYRLLSKEKIFIESKPFAAGVRIEHPQKLIDSIRYHRAERGDYLPAASYNLACQTNKGGVYSFCMCPGGIIIPASTAPKELVLNGMSVSRRDSPFANSGIVTEINEADWKNYADKGPLAGMYYQAAIEKEAYIAGGGKQRSPAQRITDFVKGKLSSELPDSSYIPGTVSAPLHEVLPAPVVERLREALSVFSKKMKGYYTEEAQILAAETRTSSPLRITRNRESLMSVTLKGLFPAGEGAGYAGGIVSAAIDGERCAEAVSLFLFS